MRSVQMYYNVQQDTLNTDVHIKLYKLCQKCSQLLLADTGEIGRAHV